MPRFVAGLWALALGTVIGLVGLGAAPAALAASAASYPQILPPERLIDPAGVFSRSAAADVSQSLEDLNADHVDARLVTVERLDYGLSLPQLGEQLLARWQEQALDRNLLVILIDAKTNAVTIQASQDLERALDPQLLRSTARTTMAAPLREGGRYRQASLDGIARLRTVLEGGEDPGDAEVAVVEQPRTNVPSREDTESSNAFTWVIVLLVVGSIVPMVTWWVFSR